MHRGFRFARSLHRSRCSIVIFACFAIQIVAAAPPIAAVLGGFVPSPEIVTNPAMLYVAIGIIGATVMPHNLYLHSSIVQTRAYRAHRRRAAATRSAGRPPTRTIALMLALFVNAAILIVAAAAFHATGHTDVAEIERGLSSCSRRCSALGIASTLFARRAARLGPQLDRDRDARRPDRHGRLSCACACRTGRGGSHPRHRDRAGGRRHRALWRAAARRNCWC